jgi:hypothetical protein
MHGLFRYAVNLTVRRWLTSWSLKQEATQSRVAFAFQTETHFFAALNFAHLALATAEIAARPAALIFPPAFSTGLNI